ncbi:MAG: hypothetical protein RR405_00720 [Clostridia bacterium]
MAELKSNRRSESEKVEDIMVLFFARGEVDSDKFIKICYSHYVGIVSGQGKKLPKEVEIVRENGKKPRFLNDVAYFNLSHSHGVVVVGISHTEIGVDIEKVREIDFEKFKFLEATDEQDFFEKWTEKESWLKLTGEGISKVKCQIPEDAHFEHFDVFEDYHVCVCAEEQSVFAYEISATEE